MTYCRCFILHYADNAITDQCIASLLPQCAAVGAEIIVIDDGSPVPYPGYKWSYKVRVIRINENWPLVRAFSESMQLLPATIYGMLNNDLICHPDMLATVLAQFDDPDVGIVAPGSSDQGTGVLYVPCAGKWGNVEVAHVDNHCYWTSQDVIDEIGWPECEGHSDFKNWYWNRFYCHLARKAGYKVIAARDAYVEHLGGGYNAEADAAGLAWIKSRLGSEVGAAL